MRAIGTSEGLFLVLVVLVAIERLVELLISRRNERRLSARGAVELGRGHYPLMVALHASFLVAGPLEVLALDRPFVPWLAWPALALVGATMSLRYWVVTTLGERWTTRVFSLPGEPLVKGGPFRWLRHPNYLAVVVEIASLPLVHGAWMTALVYSLANAFVLRARLRVENDALSRYPRRPQPRQP